jgi:hypothetical protein
MFLIKRLGFAVCFSMVSCSDVAASQERPVQASTRDVSRIRADLQEQARGLEKGSTSSFFARLADPAVRARLAISAEQTGLIGRLDEVTRAAVKSWLLRGLESSDAKMLVERLSEHGIQLRKDVVAHAEAIVSQAVLTPEQLRQYRTNEEGAKAAASDTRDEQPADKGRRASKRSTVAARAPDESVRLKAAIQKEITTIYANNDHVSDYFSCLTRKDAPSELGLSAEQTQLLDRLDQLTRDVIGGWLLRGVDAIKPPPDLAERVSARGMQHRRAVIAHAESIARRAILTPAQVEPSLRRLWRGVGTRALLDPELASRLRFRRDQREEIAARIANKDRVRQEADNTLGPLRLVHDNGGQTAREAATEIRRRAEEADRLVWDVLDPLQLDTLELLMNSKVPLPRRRR